MRLLFLYRLVFQLLFLLTGQNAPSIHAAYVVIGFLGSLPIIFVWVVIAAVVVIVVRSIRKKRKKKKE